jgi:hypothetical protein
MAEKIKFEPIADQSFILIAIVTSEPVYRICWFLNSRLGISLIESESLALLHPKRNLLQSYLLFEYFHEEKQLAYYLIQNKGPQGAFDEDQKQVDFWLRIEGDITSMEIMHELKAIKELTLAFEVKPGSIKNKSRLLKSVSEIKNQGRIQV